MCVNKEDCKKPENMTDKTTPCTADQIAKCGCGGENHNCNSSSDKE